MFGCCSRPFEGRGALCFFDALKAERWNIGIEQAISRIPKYPFQNKHQIHRHLQIAKILCPIKNKNIVVVIKWARLLN